jgi:hypothetical protein
MRAGNHHRNRDGYTSLGWEDKGWIDQELEGAYFQDVRLGKRLRTLLGLMSNGIGQTIPLAGQDWANTKAAYRFFSNPRISEEEILSGHFAGTRARVGVLKQPVLVLHDTTEFCYYSAGEAIGRLTALPFPSKSEHRIRGLLMHSSLALRRSNSGRAKSSREPSRNHVVLLPAASAAPGTWMSWRTQFTSTFDRVRRAAGA